jgi:ELWxxDGT repeat protein
MPEGYAASHATALVTTSNEAFFITRTAAGNQLWRAGGSPGPTLLLETDVPNSLSDLRAVGSRVAFTVTEQTTTKTLWGSDGTAAGTQQLGAFERFIATDDNPKDDPPVFSTGAAGALWVTDGTPAGTGPLLTLAANELVSELTHNADRAYFATSAGRVLSARFSTRATEILTTSTGRQLGLAPFGVWFVAESNDGGREPFVSDGTAAGTRLLKNIADDTATGDSLPADFIEFNAALYFTADDAVVGRELWRSDGTSAGTRLFADLVSGPASSHPVAPFVAGNRLYFFTLAGVRTLWSTDGTSAPVKVGPLDNAADTLSPWSTIDPNSRLSRQWSCPQPRAAQLGSQFYFAAFAFSTGWELWKTDGTQAGTQLAVDLAPGFQNSSLPCTVVALNNRLFYTAVDAQGSRKLWSSNGTVGGTQAIETLSAVSRFGEVLGPVVFGGALYFTTPVEDATRSRLWRSNGSVVATVVYEAAAPGANISVPVAVGNRLVFTVDTPTGIGTKTVELWATDASATGAGLLATRIASGAGAMLAAGSQLFFTRTDDATGTEPWVTDGTASGTRMIQDLAVGATDSAPLWMGSAGGVGFFLVPDANGDAVMWRTNGTSAETRSIAQFDALRFTQSAAPDPSPYFASASRFGLELVTPLVAGNHLYFAGRSPTEGIELFALESEAPTPPPPPVDSPPRRSGGGAVDTTLLALLGLAAALQFLTAVLRRRGMIVPPHRGGNPCSSSTPTRSRR